MIKQNYPNLTYVKQHLAHLTNGKNFYNIVPFKLNASYLQFAIQNGSLNIENNRFGLHNIEDENYSLPNYIVTEFDKPKNMRWNSSEFIEKKLNEYSERNYDYLNDICHYLTISNLGKIEVSMESEFETPIYQNKDDTGKKRKREFIKVLKPTTIIKEIGDKIILGYPRMKTMKYYENLPVENNYTNFDLLKCYGQILKKDITPENTYEILPLFRKIPMVPDLKMMNEIIPQEEWEPNFRKFCQEKILYQLGRPNITCDYNFFILQKTFREIKPYKTKLIDINETDKELLLGIQKLIYTEIPKKFNILQPGETFYKNFLIYTTTDEVFKIHADYYFPFSNKTAYEYHSINMIYFNELITLIENNSLKNLPVIYKQIGGTLVREKPAYKSSNLLDENLLYLLNDEKTQVINYFDMNNGLTLVLLENGKEFYYFEFKYNIAYLKNIPRGYWKTIYQNFYQLYNRDKPYQINSLIKINEIDKNIRKNLEIFMIDKCPSYNFDIRYEDYLRNIQLKPFKYFGYSISNIIKKIIHKGFNPSLKNKNTNQTFKKFQTHEYLSIDLKNIQIRESNNYVYLLVKYFYEGEESERITIWVIPQTIFQKYSLEFQQKGYFEDKLLEKDGNVIDNMLTIKPSEYEEIKPKILEISKEFNLSFIFINVYNLLPNFTLHFQIMKKQDLYQVFTRTRFINYFNQFLPIERYEKIYYQKIKPQNYLDRLMEITLPSYLFLFKNMRGGNASIKIKSKKFKTTDYLKDIEKNKEKYFLNDALYLRNQNYQNFIKFYQDKLPKITQVLKWYQEENKKLPEYNKIRNEVNIEKYLSLKNNKLKNIGKSFPRFDSISLSKKYLSGKILLITNIITVYSRFKNLQNNFDVVFLKKFILTNKDKNYFRNIEQENNFKPYNQVSGQYKSMVIEFPNFPFFGQELAIDNFISNLLMSLKYVFENLSPQGNLIINMTQIEPKKTLPILGFIEQYFDSFIIEQNTNNDVDIYFHLVFKKFKGDKINLEFNLEEVIKENNKSLMEIFNEKTYTLLNQIDWKGKPSEKLKLQIETLYKLNEIYLKQYEMQKNNLDEILVNKYKIFIRDQISKMKELDIPLSKDLRRLDEKYQLQIISEYFTLGKFYQLKLFHSKSQNYNINYQLFDKFFDSTKLEKDERKLQQQEDFQRFLDVNKYTQIFNKKISKYVSSLGYLPFNVSNAFVKAWEIYNTFDFNFHDTTRSFHFAELPGQFILSLLYYLKVNKLGKLDWYAESLNPWSKKARNTYGKNIFANDYGLKRSFENRWIFGENKQNTGDLTDIRILKFFRKFNQNRNLNFITSEAGLDKAKVPYEFYQKLDLAQIIAVLGSLGDKTACVVKQFTPYVNSFPESKNGTAFFCSLVQLYMNHFEEVYLTKPLTSNAKSGEFYVVAKGGKRIDDKTFEKYIGYLTNYELNKPVEKVNKYLVGEVYRFLEDMNEINMRMINTQNYIYTFYDEFLEDKDEIDEFLEKKYEEWVKTYKFRGKSINNYTKPLKDFFSNQI